MDESLTRPDNFDKIIPADLPYNIEILKPYLKKVSNSKDVDLQLVYQMI